MQHSVLERIAAGDADAVEECIDRYGALVWSLARRYLRRHADAEDAVQEVFIQVWRSAARFDPAIASETTFITMIARRRLIDRQRKEARAPALETIGDEPATPVRSVHQQMDLVEEAEQARSVMNRLRDEERRVLELALLEGLTHREIAEVAEMPIGTVKTHARRGMINLRAMLEPGQDAATEGTR